MTTFASTAATFVLQQNDVNFSLLVDMDSACDRTDYSIEYFAIVLYSLLMIFTIAGNLLVIAAFATESQLQAIANYWIVSLSLTDITLAITVMPLQIVKFYHGGSWILGTLACDLFIVLDVLSCTCSIYHLVLISLDRYLCVRLPVEYPQQRTSMRAILAIVLTWVFCITLAMPRLVGWKNYENEPDVTCVCTMENKSYMIFSSFVSFFIPLTLIVMMYVVIFRWTRQRASKFAAQVKARSIRKKHSKADEQFKNLRKPDDENANTNNNVYELVDAGAIRLPVVAVVNKPVARRTKSLIPPSNDCSPQIPDRPTIHQRRRKSNEEQLISPLTVELHPNPTALPNTAICRPPTMIVSPPIVDSRPFSSDESENSMLADRSPKASLKTVSKNSVLNSATSSTSHALKPSSWVRRISKTLRHTRNTLRAPPLHMLTATIEQQSSRSSSLAHVRDMDTTEYLTREDEQEHDLKEQMHVIKEMNERKSIPNNTLTYRPSHISPLASCEASPIKDMSETPHEDGEEIFIEWSTKEEISLLERKNTIDLADHITLLTFATSNLENNGVPLPNSNSITESATENSAAVVELPNRSSRLVHSISKMLLRRKHSTELTFDSMAQTTTNASSKNAVDMATRRKRALTRRRERQENRTARVVVIVIGAFVIFWAPFFILNTIEPLTRHLFSISETVWKWVTFWGYLNSSVNPLIYTFFNRTYKRAIGAVLRCDRLRGVRPRR